MQLHALHKLPGFKINLSSISHLISSLFSPSLYNSIPFFSSQVRKMLTLKWVKIQKTKKNRINSIPVWKMNSFEPLPVTNSHHEKVVSTFSCIVCQTALNFCKKTKHSNTLLDGTLHFCKLDFVPNDHSHL